MKRSRIIMRRRLLWRTLPEHRSLLQGIPLVLHNGNVAGTHREDETVLFPYSGAGDLHVETIYILHGDVPAGLENQAFAVSIHDDLGFTNNLFDLGGLASLGRCCYSEEYRQKKNDMYNRFHGVLENTTSRDSPSWETPDYSGFGSVS